MTTASIHIRLDPTLKTDAMRVLADMGTSVTEVVRHFLSRIASEKTLPYSPISAPDDGLPSEEELRIAQEQVYQQYPELRGYKFKNQAFAFPD